jgi:hypothetical protein
MFSNRSFEPSNLEVPAVPAVHSSQTSKNYTTWPLETVSFGRFFSVVVSSSPYPLPRERHEVQVSASDLVFGELLLVVSSVLHLWPPYRQNVSIRRGYSKGSRQLQLR